MNRTFSSTKSKPKNYYYCHRNPDAHFNCPGPGEFSNGPKQHVFQYQLLQEAPARIELTEADEDRTTVSTSKIYNDV